MSDNKNNILFSNDVFKISDKVNRNVLISCDHGLMIVNRFDRNQNGVGHSQWLLDHGNASTVESHHCYQKIRNIQSPIIFDVGANIGTFTTWMSKAFPDGKIFSFEPQRSVFQMLCGNVAINNLYNVYAHNYAIGEQNSIIEVYEPNYFGNEDYGTFSLVNSVIKNVTNQKLIVEVKTIDWIIDLYSVPRVDLIKIDVEGMDLSVLKGARQMIEKFHPCIFIEHFDYRVSILKELESFLDQYEYKYTIFENNLITL